MWQTRVTEMFGIEYPIVQGGLAHLAFAPLAAAVSNAGGLGQITAASFHDAEELRREIRLARELTDRPFAVNFAIGRRDLKGHVRVTREEGVPAVSITGGNPAPFLEAFAGTGVKSLVLVASTRQAQKAESLGASAVIAVGQEGGGHLGRDDVGTLVLVPRVVDSVRIPVLASGGIGDGRGLAAALALGADGIEMGTRFVATRECIAHSQYKEALVHSHETDTRVIERSIGRPGRALASEYVERILQLEQAGISEEELYPYISGEANKRAAIEGRLAEGFVWAGQVTGLIRDLPTVAELIERMTREAREAVERARRLMG